MINVLVVDDSAFMRKIFSEKINSEPGLTVIDTARNGEQALEKIAELKPDIITLDIEMPVRNGLETLKVLRRKHPALPVLMVSALDNRDTVMKALEMGAFDFIPKPSGSISLDIDDIEKELLAKLKTGASSCQPAQNTDKSHITLNERAELNGEKKKTLSRKGRFPIIAMGASSGGPRAVKQILSSLPRELPAALAIVQHMPAGFTTSLARRLNQESALEVKEAEPGDRLKPGSVLLAPGDYHMVFSENRVELNQRPRRWGVRPCADYMMSSLAALYDKRVIGVILTGMGSDGGEGMKAIKEHGGYGIVEDESTALVYGMPRTVIETGAYDEILPREDIPARLLKVIERREN